MSMNKVVAVIEKVTAGETERRIIGASEYNKIFNWMCWQTDEVGNDLEWSDDAWVLTEGDTQYILRVEEVA